MLAIAVLAGAGSAAADPARAAERPLERKLAVHVEVASALSHNAGAGSIGGLGDGSVVEGAGGQLAGHLLFGGAPTSLELAAGVSLHADHDDQCGTNTCMPRWDIGLAPYFFLGLRHQALSRRESGFSYRAGIGGLTYGFGLGVIVGVGHAF